jgi:hypothetical protein
MTGRYVWAEIQWSSAMSRNLQSGRQPRGKTPEALVVVVAADDVEAEAALFREKWQSAVPKAEFFGLRIAESDSGLPKKRNLASRLAEVVAARSLSQSRTILLGQGNAVRTALDLELSGHARTGGVLAFDIALWELPSAGPHCRTIVRLLQHRSATDPSYRRFVDLLDEIRRRTLDLRYLLLTAPDERTKGAAFRAGVNYLAELVANVSNPQETREQAP